MYRHNIRHARLIAAVLTVVGLSGSLVVSNAALSSAQDPYSMSIPAAGESSPALKRYYQQRIQWGSCAQFAGRSWALDKLQLYAGSATMECGVVDVPVVYPDVIAQDKALGNPWKVEAGRPHVIKLAVSRVKAKGRRWGGMLINPGGPGGSGLNMPAGLEGPAVEATILEHFDLVGFDPRGIGASLPSLKCLTDKQNDAKRVASHGTFSKEDVAFQNARNRDYVNGCVKDVGATFLAHMGTRDVVRDMDIIRAAIGDKKLTYIGYSYGTFLGSQYAEAFPNSMRALVLDGVVDPTQDIIEGDVNQGKGFQQAFNAWAKWCVKQGKCPLGDNPANATKEFHKLVWPLHKKPMYTPVMSRPLSWADSVQAVIASLYSQTTWPLLKAGLTQLKMGLGGDILLALSDGYYGRWIDGTYSTMQDVFGAVGCMDNDVKLTEAQRLELTRRMIKAMPFADPGGKIEAVPLDPCSIWPARNTIRPHAPTIRSKGNILVVSTTGDPATPYEAGVRLARDLDAPLATFVGEGHCAALRGQPCVDKYVGDFIVRKKVYGPHVTCKGPVG